jgi:hypothetical protein
MFTTISESVAVYDDVLNESGPAVIAGMEFDPAYVLNELDPIAYKTGWIDFMDSLGVDTGELEDDFTFDRDRR